MNRKTLPGTIGKAIALFLFFIVIMFPIYWLYVTSFKPAEETVSKPVRYWPEHVTLENYVFVLANTKFPYFFFNSILVAVVTGTATVFLSIFAGYSLSRFQFRGKQLTLVLFLATQMIPVIILIVPLFILFRDLLLLNTLISLMIVYTVIALPFCTLMITGFFRRIPVSLEESAMIDGCTRFGSIFRVIVPVMLPGIVATFVFAFLAAWNEFFFAIMFINTEIKKTIPVGISMFIQKVNVNWGMMTASAGMALLPAAFLFMLIQKYIIAGLTEGSVKG